jgi:hypothetical protein
MLNVIKIENGLNWNNEDRFFTNEYYEFGYQIADAINLTIELDNQIYGMCVESATIDGITYNTSNDFVNAIF